MASDLVALCIDARDPAGLAAFWSGLLGWEPVAGPGDGVTLVPRDDTAYRLRFVASQEEKTGPNRIHLDLASASPEQQADTVGRALGLGARRLDLGLGPDEHHVPLADPEGNELCVIEAGNRFLAGCGIVGAINCEGTRDVGHFWSRALDWPLVWDQDEETAIQSPAGGTKITWSGPPVPPKTGKGRLHLDLAARGDLAAEVARLVDLGAARIGADTDGWAPLADPDGNEFCVGQAPRES